MKMLRAQIQGPQALNIAKQFQIVTGIIIIKEDLRITVGYSYQTPPSGCIIQCTWKKCQLSLDKGGRRVGRIGADTTAMERKTKEIQ